MIAQYGERHRKGANGEGWASISHVFQAVIASFVTGDKVKRRTAEERSRLRICARVTANLWASQNADQLVLLHKERAENERDPNAELRAHIRSLKGELDELIYVVESGSIVGSRKTYCHKCGVGVVEFQANGKYEC